MSENILNTIPIEIIVNDIFVYLCNYDLFHFGMTCKRNQELCELVWEKKFKTFTSQSFLFYTLPLNTQNLNLSKQYIRNRDVNTKLNIILDNIYKIDKKKYDIIYGSQTTLPVLKGLYWYTMYTLQSRLTFCEVLRNSAPLKDFGNYESVNGILINDHRPLNFETSEETFEYIYRNKMILQNDKLVFLKDAIRQKLIDLIRSGQSLMKILETHSGSQSRVNPMCQKKSEIGNKYYRLIFGRI